MDMRRGVDIEVKIATKRPNLKFDLLKELERELENISPAEEGTPCSECESLQERPKLLKVKPAYPCDSWDGRSRTCWLDRNVGDTVTFVLAFSEGHNPTVRWRQNFHSIRSGREKFYNIDPENPLWNIVVGSKGHELRLSPITEIDIDDNSFSAHVIEERVQVHFRVRVMPVDQGFVYPGETLIMNMKRVSLPSMSMTFKWYLESDGEGGTLPSNMKLSPSGGVLTVSELRKEQEGILTCAVYTNLGLFATKQRFLIKEMNQTGNMLLFVPTRPTHFNEIRKKREIDSEKEFDDVERQNDDAPVDGGGDFAVEGIDVYAKNAVEEVDADAFREEQHNQLTTSGRSPPDRLQEPSIVLEVKKKPRKNKMQSQSELSKLLSRCTSSLQCSADAHCISGYFCKCNSGFQGAGIFCWENRKDQLQ